MQAICSIQVLEKCVYVQLFALRIYYMDEEPRRGLVVKE